MGIIAHALSRACTPPRWLEKRRDAVSSRPRGDHFPESNRIGKINRPVILAPRELRLEKSALEGRTRRTKLNLGGRALPLLLRGINVGASGAVIIRVHAFFGAAEKNRGDTREMEMPARGTRSTTKERASQ